MAPVDLATFETRQTAVTEAQSEACRRQGGQQLLGLKIGFVLGYLLCVEISLAKCFL